MIPPTVASAVISVPWDKNAQMAHAHLVRAQPIVTTNPLILPQIPKTVVNAVSLVHQAYPAEAAVV